MSTPPRVSASFLPRVPVLPPVTIRLEMDETTAGYLRTLTGAITGLGAGYTANAAVYHALGDAGVASSGSVRGTPYFVGENR